MTVNLQLTALSRRAALATLGTGGLGLALALRRGDLSAQEATPDAGMIPAAIQAWADAWGTGDVEHLLSLYTDDAVFEEVAFGEAITGKDALRETFTAEFASFTGISITVTGAFQSGDMAAAEASFSFTYTNSAEGLPPASGQQATVRAAVILEFDGDLIRRESEYFDAYAVLSQLGAFGESEEESAEATATS